MRSIDSTASGQKTCANTYCCEGLPLEAVLAAGRYVDDTVGISRLFCQECIWKMICDAYDSTLTFERQGPEWTSRCEWLGMELSEGDRLDPVRVQSLQSERTWLDGDSEFPKRHRIPCCEYGEEAQDVLRAQATGNISRWFQMGLKHVDLAEATSYELDTWRKVGYAWRTTRKVWSGLACRPGGEAIETCLRFHKAVNDDPSSSVV